MKFDRNSLLLYLCTDRQWLGSNSLAQQVEESIVNGVTFVQLREKEMPLEQFAAEAREIKTVCGKYHIPFVINDNVDVALAVDADGVHIGQSDEALTSARKRLGKEKVIGVSAGNIQQARRAKEGGADYIGVGAVFPTDTKRDADTLSPAALREICTAVDIPVVAIGGITKNNLFSLDGSGIDGVAVISAILAQPDIGRAARELRTLAGQMVKKP